MCAQRLVWTESSITPIISSFQPSNKLALSVESPEMAIGHLVLVGGECFDQVESGIVDIAREQRQTAGCRRTVSFD